MRVIIRPERILWVLVGVAAVLGFMHLATRYIMLQGIESPTMRKLLDLFNMNLEVSIPTWYSQMLLIFAALVAGFIGLVRRAQGGEVRDSLARHRMHSRVHEPRRGIADP